MTVHATRVAAIQQVETLLRELKNLNNSAYRIGTAMSAIDPPQSFAADIAPIMYDILTLTGTSGAAGALLDEMVDCIGTDLRTALIPTAETGWTA